MRYHPITTSFFAIIISLASNGCGSPSGSQSPQEKANHPAHQVIDFEADPIGKVPDGWKIDATDAGVGGTNAPLAFWEVLADQSKSGNRVLALTNADQSQDQTFNLCLTDRIMFQDGTLRIRFRSISGEVDQGGGPVWRVRDRDHYYICRANPLESNFRVYKVIGGVRKQLGSIKVAIPSGAHNQPGPWYTIEIEQSGDRIVCTLDGASRLEVTDSSLPDAGGIGVWTKADALTQFDDLVIESKVPAAKAK